MNNKTLLIFDFDRTLFNLTDFLRDVQVYLWGLPITKDSELALRNETLKVFRNLDTITPEINSLLWLAPRLLPKSNYLYEDARALLQNLPEHVEPIVITHGVSEHKQYFKRGFASTIHDLPFYVTYDNKGLLIRDSIRAHPQGVDVRLPNAVGIYDKVVLVDDNPISFEPLIDSPIEQFHLSRKNEPHAKKRSARRVTKIRDLGQLANYL